MPNCAICSEPLRVDQKVCDVCGTSVPEVAPEFLPRSPSPPAPVTGPPPLVETEPVSSGRRICPLCSATYEAAYADEFCCCGGELIVDTGIAPLPGRPEARSASPLPPAKPARPPTGTVCLVVYSEREPIHYCTIDKDVTIIGRGDPVRGDFPDLDLGELLDSSVALKVSRKHAMVLRSRDKQLYVLRPLAGNTGTQIEKDLATALQDYPLSNGTRIVLGGVVRIKFDTL